MLIPVWFWPFWEQTEKIKETGVCGQADKPASAQELQTGVDIFVDWLVILVSSKHADSTEFLKPKTLKRSNAVALNWWVTTQKWIAVPLWSVTDSRNYNYIQIILYSWIVRLQKYIYFKEKREDLP